MGKRSVATHLGLCLDCDKFLYGSRKKSRRAARANHPDKTLSPYPCPASPHWHYGHLKVAVIKGATTRYGERAGYFTPNPAAAGQIRDMWAATHRTTSTA